IVGVEDAVVGARRIVPSCTITSGGTTLAGVTVEVQGASTTTDGSGRFSLKLPAGTWTVRFRKVGYARHDEQVTLAPAAQTTVNLSMDTTTLGWAYGQVTGVQDEPLAGMQVEAVRGETVLAQT
ncbi:MAG TPA: carboxypeptidase regulatory-like domain-containing protein, partial [Candidatus Cryosericum sp.]|nr:carboxypeptidase regulatory-like domain-containing protein [Candidatus Cryosericum sp.]